MRLFLLAVCFILTACASTPKEYEHIRVKGVGNTVEAAKQDAFKNAIEIKAGTLVLSDRETLNLHLVKDEILVYSSGYIDNYTIIRTHTFNKEVEVTMDVWVADSKLKARILAVGDNKKHLEGDRHSTRYNSYLSDRHQGDKIINYVFKEYPKKAYILDQGKHQLLLDGNRNALLIVPYEMRWNYNFIVVLKETLNMFEDGRNGLFTGSPGVVSVMVKDPKDLLLGKRTNYHFNDMIRFDNINNLISGHNEARIKLTIKDKSYKIAYTKCIIPKGVMHQGGPEGPIFYVNNNNWLGIYGNAKDVGQFKISISPNSYLQQVMKDLYMVDMNVVPAKECN